MGTCCGTSAKRRRIYQWILMVWLSITWVLWIVTTIDCRMILIGNENLSINQIMNGYGIYQKQVEIPEENSNFLNSFFDQCRPYRNMVQEDEEATPNQNEDKEFVIFDKEIGALQNIGRMFGAFGLIFHTIAILCSILIQCCTTSRKVLYTGRVMIASSFLLFTAMVFLFFYEFLFGDCIFATDSSGNNNTSVNKNDIDNDNTTTNKTIFNDEKDGQMCFVGPTGVVAIINSFALIVLMFTSWIITGPIHPCLQIKIWKDNEEKNYRAKYEESNESYYDYECDTGPSEGEENDDTYDYEDEENEEGKEEDKEKDNYDGLRDNKENIIFENPQYRIELWESDSELSGDIQRKNNQENNIEVIEFADCIKGITDTARDDSKEESEGNGNKKNKNKNYTNNKRKNNNMANNHNSATPPEASENYHIAKGNDSGRLSITSTITTNTTVWNEKEIDKAQTKHLIQQQMQQQQQQQQQQKQQQPEEESPNDDKQQQIWDAIESTCLDIRYMPTNTDGSKGIGGFFRPVSPLSKKTKAKLQGQNQRQHNEQPFCDDEMKNATNAAANTNAINSTTNIPVSGDSGGIVLDIDK